MRNCQNASRLAFNVVTQYSWRSMLPMIGELISRAAGKSTFRKFLPLSSANTSGRAITETEGVSGRNGGERCTFSEKSMLKNDEAGASSERGV